MKKQNKKEKTISAAKNELSIRDTQLNNKPNGTEEQIIDSGFPIIGIGASAGGLAAIESFFKAIPDNATTPMAFIIVQHLDPTHKSLLIDIVKQYTKMKVFKVENGIKLHPGCIYIIPPNCDMSLLHGNLYLIEPGKPRGLRLPIDFFFRSLAQDLHERAIGIILSGTGTDGTLGIKAIKAEGGMVIVQSPESAEYDGMPRSAIATNLIDYILPPDKMHSQLLNDMQHIFGQKHPQETEVKSNTEDILKKAFIIIRDRTGHDFSNYKRNTILRRIERRMAVNQIEHLEDYIRYLKSNIVEVETLFRELLIGVTNFFRDTEVFISIKENIFPKLFADKISGATIRIWIPGCSTGEEAYSFAILLQEYIDSVKQNFNVQIFATDIDAESIEKARSGVFLQSIAADVSHERLSQFFTLENDTYRVRKTIRDMVVFARQDVIKDPPFSKLDLISCRNLLIYLGSKLQKKVISLFHYALNQNGFLVLGTSESIGDFLELFSVIDKKSKIFRSKGMTLQHSRTMTYSPPLFDVIPSEGINMTSHKEIKTNIKEMVERSLMEYTPPCVIINSDFDILYLYGRTGKYLEHATGEANLNLTKMVREELKMELISGVRKVIAKQTLIRYDGLKVINDSGNSIVNLIIQPVNKTGSSNSLIMVIFEAVAVKAEEIQGIAGEPVTDKDQRISELEKKVKEKEEYLQTTVEELETSNEELKSTNEELQSSNEELQSTNEELETSKEELQSVNEELMTVNAEHQKKIEELSRVNNDMNNLLAGTGIGTIFVDHKLMIQRFTPAATQIINLINADIGRPVSHIVSRLNNYEYLINDVKQVLDTLVPKEAEVQTTEGRHYNMRIQPYHTIENVIEGAVLTFVEIAEQKKKE